MIQHSFAARFALCIAFATALLPGLSGRVAASQPQQLEPYVTTATRTPASPQSLGSAVQIISGFELDRRQVSSLAAALGSTPGAPVFASGAPGSAASVFLRGANSNQMLFLVDGIRVSDPNTDYQMMLGGITVGRGDRVEIARGPQSTLYGAEAIGGVVSLGSARGSGAPSSNVAIEGGSFGTIRGGVTSQGEAGANAWNFSARATRTENERPNNEFKSANASLRLDRRINERTSAGSTIRWYRGELGSPGDRFTNDVNDTETENNVLATAFVEMGIASDWNARATLGGQERRYVADTPAPNAWQLPSAKTIVTNRRAVLDGQTSYTGLQHHRFTVGGTAEATHTRNTGFGSINDRQALWAGFAQDEITLAENLFVTAGLRHDDFDTFGGATTGRGTLAWLLIPRVLKLRASYGTGFRSPSFLELYGKGPYYEGNAGLAPERSRGADAGFDLYLPNHRGTISVTWFESAFTNLIEYDFQAFPATVRNVGRARTRGVELAARVLLVDGVEGSLAYTYLDARSLENGGRDRLLRRPRHQFAADLLHECGHGVTVGAGFQFSAQREDVDAASYATIDAEDFTVVRIHARWQATAAFAVNARVENLFDEEYEPVNGYPAAGVAAYAGVEWRF